MRTNIERTQQNPESQDKITGFQGIVTGRCEYITGCTQVLVAPPCKEDGSSRAAGWFDEDRVYVVDAEVVMLPRTRAGFDAPAPVR